MSSKTRLAQAYYDLSVMMDAGVPILRSLDITIEGRQGYIKQVLKRIRETVSKGSSLTEALDQHRNVFPQLDRMLIEAAETSGALGLSFKMLSEWHEFVHRITRRLQMGLIYPFFMLHIAAGVFGLPGLVLGKTSTTEYLVGTVSILMLLYVPTAIVVVCMALRERFPLLGLPLDFIVLRIPILGQAVYHMSVCRYAKAFAMMYGAGVPITEVTDRATRATGNAIVARLFAGGKDSVRAGGLAWEGYSKRLPSQYLHLFQIGEETGELDKTAEKIAEIAGDRADLLFTAFAKWLPIAVYVVIAGIIIYMIFTLWGQIYSGLPGF
ncbi:type II secretion system F family protein [Anaerobaca lacustris]|uniref:Type II secretion system F family protein n=1 Tax=Anaerobaca lacustris TaxID=3044600 RepID=A0AAW6TV69_9BACT|nr:type II secretion system F family protein [Sedimentisphaerales bacterium M17dextr]